MFYKSLVLLSFLFLSVTYSKGQETKHCEEYYENILKGESSDGRSIVVYAFLQKISYGEDTITALVYNDTFKELTFPNLNYEVYIDSMLKIKEHDYSITIKDSVTYFKAFKPKDISFFCSSNECKPFEQMTINAFVQKYLDKEGFLILDKVDNECLRCIISMVLKKGKIYITPYDYNEVRFLFTVAD